MSPVPWYANSRFRRSTWALCVGATTGAVFDAYAPKGDLAWAAADLGSTIRGAEVG